MKNILLVGGAGYIGSHTLLALAEQNKYNLFVFDDFKNGNIEAVSIVQIATNSKIKTYSGDIRNTSELSVPFAENKIDIVIHFAALIEAGVSVKKPLDFFENNVSGSINLLKVMALHNVRNIVFSSTAAVYGTVEGGEATENTPIQYESPYGSSKYFVEEILRSLSNMHVDESQKINSIILRYFNACGADPKGRIGQAYPNPTHMITVAIEAALGMREKLVIFGKDYDTIDGTCIRDYIHVADLANAHVAAIEKFIDGFEGSEYCNLGTGMGTSNAQLVKILEEIHGKFNYEYGERRPGDAQACYTNPAKANKFLNWKSTYSIHDAVLHAYNWKKKMPNGFKI